MESFAAAVWVFGVIYDFFFNGDVESSLPFVVHLQGLFFFSTFMVCFFHLVVTRKGQSLLCRKHSYMLTDLTSTGGRGGGRSGRWWGGRKHCVSSLSGKQISAKQQFPDGEYSGVFQGGERKRGQD